MSSEIQISIVDDDEQSKIWEILYDRIKAVLRRFGNENAFGKGDYWILDDNWGNRQHKIEVQNLILLKSGVVKSLRALLAHYPDWDIVIAVHIPGKQHLWPPMGLIIRSHEIIDGLQRQYFPKEFQNLQYQGSRRGTDRD